MNLFYRAVKAIAWPFAHIIWWIKCKNRNVIPNEEGIILCCNHSSLLDVVFLIITCKREIYFMGKDELFDNKLAGWFLRKMNAFSIKREAVGKESIQYAINLVKDNKVLGIFPEGTRSKDGTPQKAKAGIALIASQTGASIVPVSIKYKNDKAGVFKRITIRYGEIISKDTIAIQEGSRGELRRVTTLIMDAIRKQWEMGL